MCHDSARYWKDSDKQCQPSPCSCGGYLQEVPNNNNRKTAKKIMAVTGEGNEPIGLYVAKGHGPQF